MSIKNHIRWNRFFSFILLFCMSFSLSARTKIAILEFELKDMTLAPRTPAEIKRTASIKPLLEAELKSADYTIFDIDLESQKMADSGVGYLFDHHDVAAKLGKQFGADYVLVGRLHKPSFLFAYEAKGPNIKLTKKTVESLTVKIDKTLDNNYTPPPPSKKTKIRTF
jgi:hypothetical protein